ncbi:MAG: hybrid sensor histidine kinase/response regulator [Deltaproteobacteria bacterium]|nr:hybrid sensor histidine kinase/response regulator [Deltaproteobacteria bacterium]
MGLRLGQRSDWAPPPGAGSEAPKVPAAPRSPGFRLPAAAGLASALLGAVVLLGWALELPRLKSILPGAVTMKPNTALGFLLAGLALTLLSGAPARWARRTAQVLACLLLALGLLTILEYAAGLDLRIDQALFRDESHPAHTLVAGRMSPATAVSFALLGASLLLASQARLALLTELFALFPGLLGLVAFHGYVYGVPNLHGEGLITYVAIHTATGLLFLAVGTLLVLPHGHVRRHFSEQSLAGTLARWSLPAAVLVPALLGWAKLLVEGLGLVSPRTGTALLISTQVALMLWLVWRTVRLAARLEGQLRVAGRMAAVGTFASGVAHEINNPLTYVIGNVSLAAERMPELVVQLESAIGTCDAIHDCPAIQKSRPVCRAVADSLRETEVSLQEAQQGAERVRQIVRDLRTFSRAEDPGAQIPAAVTPALQAAVNLCRNELRHHARVVEEYEPSPLVLGNPSRMGQIFVNLLSNAAQAIPEGHAEANEVRVRCATDDEGFAVVEISDTGGGIHPEHLPRIFDPFSTTKPVGQGTGLGLSICRSLVEELHGTVDVQSSPGHGTRFRVRLPPASPAKAGELGGPATGARRPDPVAPPAVRKRILIVDDDAMVAGTLRRVLGQEYELTLCAGGKEALTLLASDARFDLVLCDLMMPETSGAQVYDAVATRHPELLRRFAFITGGAFSGAARQALERAPVPCFEKPFQVDALRERVRQLLS